MTAAITTPSDAHLGVNERDEHVARMWAAIEPEFLVTMGWDPKRRVLIFPQEHPQLGWNVCRVAGCHNHGRRGWGLCPACTRRWQALDGVPVEEFLAMPKPMQRCIGIGPCAVQGCQRPWKSARLRLCDTHDRLRRTTGLSLEQFLTRPNVVPLASFGPCAVAACTRDRIGRGPYCHQHQKSCTLATKHDPHLDIERWRRTTSAVAENSEVSLRGLPPRIVAEVIFGLQQRTTSGAKTSYLQLRPLCDLLRRSELASIEDLAADRVTRHCRVLAASIVKAVRRHSLAPDTERHNDVWDLFVFGHAGNLTFTGISQSWLREAAKCWAHEDLPRRRGNRVGNVAQGKINSLVRLSESLRLQRADRGENLVALAREDITAFCSRMAYLQDQDQISARTRLNYCRDVRRVLSRMRAMGLTRSGKPLHGLPEDFVLTQDDLPDECEDAEAGRDLPVEVIRVLCANLAALEQISGREVRVAVELMIDTGRRPDEICQLALSCLDRDGDGEPVLVYDNRKAHRKARRLPIPAATAALIAGQQDRVRARFPDTPVRELTLLPTAQRNPAGRQAVSTDWVTSCHRAWVDGLPEVHVSTVVEIDGKPVTTLLPFDKDKITPYAHRHSYAQRHADAGVDVTVLQELMDHRRLSTTQIYYRVGDERRREAVERVTTMQFDRHGNRVWRQAKAMLDSEHTRRAVGEVAVPYGGCSEPSNVAAGGQDCPVRFRCIGCGHFSTDISHLPDLERYLDDLLRHRERLRATVDADEWAKTEAMPSDEEITRIRRLIDRMKGDLDGLTEDERAQIDEAVAVVRRGRAKVVGLGMPRVRQPVPDLRPERSA